MVTKRVTNTSSQIQNNKDPSVLKTGHPNHFVEYYPKEESLQAMTEEHVLTDQRQDDVFEWFLKQRIGKLNKLKKPITGEFIPLPIAHHLLQPQQPCYRSTLILPSALPVLVYPKSSTQHLLSRPSSYFLFNPSKIRLTTHTPPRRIADQSLQSNNLSAIVAT